VALSIREMREALGQLDQLVVRRETGNPSPAATGMSRPPEDIRRRFGRILDREVGHSDMSFFKGRRAILFELGCGEGGARLSYSSDKNRFYEVEAPEEFYRPRCSDDPRDMKVRPNPLRVIQDSGSR
jgi:hypothetical protein